MNPRLKVMLENKHISIGENKYRLTIEKKRLPYTDVIGYVAYLSDIDSQYTNQRSFDTVQRLEKGLKAWIIESDMLNNPESAVFQQLKDWDGVINI